MNYGRTMMLCACYQLLVLFGKAQKTGYIHNPVLPGVADAGVLKHNGEYYIGGVFTNGGYYVSDDLVNWKGPVHVFSMNNGWTGGPSAGDNQIHANDISYINGTFHLYWSVNYWGQDRNVVHIGHAVADSILGPYTEPVKDTWLDNRIDPMLFTDDDGKLYLYMVKFTDGNTIWARPMKDPATFDGPPVYQFASLPRTWETMDNRVAEGPWVMKYRNRYYMMYNANHTSTAWGNYMLGVAEADSPMGFEHGGKYPGPVVFSNQYALEDEFVDLLKGPDFRYATVAPGESWNRADFDASSWDKGKPGFGSTVIQHSTARNILTTWNTSGIWARKTFTIKHPGNLLLRIHHDGDTRVYLNGEPVYEKTGAEYTTLNLDGRKLLKSGENVLAVQSSKGRRNAFLDISLFDMQAAQGDDILYSPGQPNILRGPNGFEWWLIYMANKNAERRGQFINRVHFFNRRLFVEGITSNHTPGYHPVPAMPDFRDLFNEATDQWKQDGGNWQQRDHEFVQTATGTAQAFIKSTPASCYLFETGVRANKAKAGIIAAWKDGDNWLKIWLDAERGGWGYMLSEKGKRTSAYQSLPRGFTYDRYHTITVFKNAESFEVKIDHLPVRSIHTALTGKCVPGLYTNGAGAAFDGVLYTIGWDEFDNNVKGWGASKGNWIVDSTGITQTEANSSGRIFKGDMLDTYEVGAQVTMAGETGSAGLYPVYTNEDNYLKAEFDGKQQKLVISGKLKGASLPVEEVSLETAQRYYADMKYTDFFEKHFSLDHPAWINAISFDENVYGKMDIFYKSAGKWHPLTVSRVDTSGHPAFDKIVFDPVKAEGLKFVNKQPGDQNMYAYQVRINEIFRGSYHLRAVKSNNEVIFFVDGREVKRYPAAFPASQVGLSTTRMRAGFNGITCFHIP